MPAYLFRSMSSEVTLSWSRSQPQLSQHHWQVPTTEIWERNMTAMTISTLKVGRLCSQGQEALCH